jgi:hypothetical protein
MPKDPGNSFFNIIKIRLCRGLDQFTKQMK